MRLFELLYYLILGLPNSIFYVYTWRKLSKDSFRFNKFINIIFIILLSLFLAVTHNYVTFLLRIILVLVILILLCYLIFHSKLNTTLSVTFSSLVIIMVAELIFSVIYTILMNTEYIKVLDTRITSIIANVLISAIACILVKIPLTEKIYLRLDKLFNKLKNYHILLLSILILFSVNFLFTSSYYEIDIKWLIIINTVISIIYMIIVFKVFSIENKYIRITNKYNTTLTSLKEYEEILDKYKIMNHENKNELLMIRNMISKGEENVEKYIDKIIDVKIKDDEKLMFETSIIPSGGLRATIYSKLLTMKDKKVKNNLHVDKSVRKFDLSDYSDDFVLDLCKIVSIFIDNAIEATLLSKKKELLIDLFIDSDDIFNICISNTYNGILDLTKIDNKGYTTKGDGHGYGLSLAVDLLNKNKKITNERKITNKVFTQILKIEK